MDKTYTNQSQNFTINSKNLQYLQVSYSNIFQEKQNNFEIFNIYNDIQYLNIAQEEKRGKYKKYSQQLKEKAINFVKQDGVPPKIVSQKLHIPLKNLVRWMQIGAIRKKGGGRKIQDNQMELNLKEWIQERMKNGNLPAAKEIKKMAKKFINPKYQSSFKASKGWLEKFLKRNNIHNIKGKIHYIDYQNKIQDQPEISNIKYEISDDQFDNILNLVD